MKGLFNKRGLTLTAKDTETAEQLAKVKDGSVIQVNYSQPRNVQFHRKYFKLLSTAFEYWQPAEQTDFSERGDTFLANAGETLGSDDLKDKLSALFCKSFAKELKTGLPIVKNLEQFREDIIIMTGHYFIVQRINGHTYKAKSISFGKMTSEEFNDLYKRTQDILWEKILPKLNDQDKKNFENELLNF